MANKILIGSIGMVLVILTGSVYFMWLENVKIVVDNSKTDFYVWESNSWVLGASESINLYNGSKKLYAIDRGVTYDVSDNVTNIKRIIHYPNNISLSVVYDFDGTVGAVELIPISERSTCVNCEGLILQYEYKNIDYKGVSRDAMSPERFGHNMNVEWGGGAYYAKVFQYLTTSDKLVIKYKPTQDIEEYDVRMFDPANISINFSCYQESANVSNQSGTDGGVGCPTLNYTGKYSFNNQNWLTPANIVDGSFATVTNLNTTFNTNATIYINYTKPNGGIGANWLVKTGDFNPAQNFSIPFSCFNQSNTTLMLLFNERTSPGDNNSLSCWNSTVWINLTSYDAGYNNFYEDAVWWIFSTTTLINGSLTNFTINNYTRNITVEMGSNIILFATANVTNESVCFDSNHPQYGVNFSCNLTNNTYNFLPTYFRTTSFNDTNITRNITINATSVNVTLGVSAHQYDEVVGMTLNVTTITSVGSPQLLIYVNDTLSNNLSLVNGDLLNLFSDGTSEKQFGINHGDTELVGYFEVKKAATVIRATFNVNGTTNYVSTLPLPNSSYYPYVVMEATGTFTPGVFSGDTVISSFTDPSSGSTKYVVWDNVSSDSYEVKRAKVYNAVFFSGSLSGKGVSYLASTDLADIGYKAYRIDASADDPGSTARSVNTYATFSGGNTSKTSVWFSGYSYYETTRGYMGLGNQIYSLLGYPSSSSTLNTDQSAYELANTTGVQVYARGDHGSSSSISAYFLTNISTNKIAFSGVAAEGCSFYFHCSWSYEDYSTSLGIPALSYWKENYTTENTRIIVGSLDGHWDWNITGSFTNYNSTQNFNASINAYLSSCVNDSDGYCLVPVYAYSLYDGGIKITNISINLTTSNNPLTISTSAITRFLNRSNGFTSIPLTFVTNINATLKVDDVKYDYLGGNKTYSVTAHTPNYGSNVSYNITYFYSDWDYALPAGTDYFEFIPSSATSKNVSPQGQRDNGVPILNITTYNYGGAMNFNIYLNESFSCINMSYKVTNYSGYCYQETANIATDCGGLSTGTYNATGVIFHYANGFDGVWDEEGVVLGYDFGQGNFTIVYPKPLNAVSGIWQFSYGSYLTPTIINVTIPNDCFNSNANNLTLQVFGLSQSFYNFTCQNGSNWIYLFNYDGQYITSYIHEEAMYWYIDKKILNNQTWTNLGQDKNYTSNIPLYLYLDYGCSSNTGWNLWYPDISFRGCASGVDVCSAELS